MKPDAIVISYFFHRIALPEPTGTWTSKSQRSQLNQFLIWLQERELDADFLAAYASYLRDERHLEASSIGTHLATIRSWLRALLRDETTRSDLYARLPSAWTQSDRESWLLKFYVRLWRNVDPKAVPVIVAASTPSAGFLPSHNQIQQLLSQLSLTTLRQRRDATIMVFLAFLGLRLTEIVALDVADVGSKRNAAVAHFVLNVRESRGSARRELPLDHYQAVAVLTQQWMEAAGIRTGPLFRGFYQGFTTLRPEPLSQRSVERILVDYPVQVNREFHVFKPLELRRFAAWLLAVQGHSLDEMRQWLGVAQSQTILDYLGGDLPSHSDRDQYVQSLYDELESLIR